MASARRHLQEYRKKATRIRLRVNPKSVVRTYWILIFRRADGACRFSE